MRYRTAITTRLFLPLVFLVGALYSCADAGLFESMPQLGDTRQRQIDGMTMVFVPSGEFTMGIDYLGLRYALELCKETGMGPAVCKGETFADEMPAHPVKLDPFWIDLTEVTNQQYERCVQDQSCSPPFEMSSYTRESYFGDPLYSDYPVVWITQDQAAAYCSWTGGRLPTEAEWEYAARGPESRTFPWGEDFEPDRANYCDAACAAGPNDPSYDDGYPETAPVGSFPTGVSWCGALDMAGNVREWVADWFGYFSADQQVNPQGPVEGETHIPKGGCWLDTPEDLRSSNRGQNTPDYTRHKVGFRCVMDLEGSKD
jgi:formylglycine-generating enzyme required for sulfatase activity